MPACREPEHVLRDLRTKVAQDVTDATRRTADLVGHPGDRLTIALASLSATIGCATACYYMAILGQRPPADIPPDQFRAIGLWLIEAAAELRETGQVQQL